MFLAGAIFLVGGILESLSLSREPSWFLIIPYSAESNAAAFLGLALMISGISLIVFGIAAGLMYSHDRSWYMQELRKANSLDDAMMSNKTAKANRKKKNGKL